MIEDVEKRAFGTLDAAENHHFLYKDAINIIDQNMEDLKKKQVREMLIYKANQTLRRPEAAAPKLQ